MLSMSFFMWLKKAMWANAVVIGKEQKTTCKRIKCTRLTSFAAPPPVA
jgi:hypothetical protein